MYTYMHVYFSRKYIRAFFVHITCGGLQFRQVPVTIMWPLSTEGLKAEEGHSPMSPRSLEP